MLISPAKIHSLLTSLITPPATSTSTSTSTSSSTSGPHTALLIYPNGQLVSCASIPLDDDDSSSTSQAAKEQDGASREDGDGDEGDEEEEEDDEPYLESQERKRLLLGLASQWNENESGKMECELGKLHFTYIHLPPPDQTSSNGKESLPTIKPYPVDGFVLVLNGTKDVDWKVLVNKSEEFKDKWCS